MKKITIVGLVVWSIASLFFLYEFFSRTFIGTIAGNIMREMQLSAFELSVIGAVYYVAYAGMQIPVGIIIDRYGVKRPLVFAILFCTLGLFLFSMANSFITLLIARLFMGLGSAFAFVSLLVLALNWFPKKNFGFFSGATQILGAIGPILSGAPLVALLVATNNNWQLVINYVAVIGLLLAILVLFIVRDYPKTTRKPKYSQKPPEPTLKNLKTLLKNQKVLWVAAYAFCIFAAISVLGAIWGTFFLETHYIHRNVAASITSMIWLGLALGSPLFGFLSDRFQQRRIFLFLCAFVGFIVTGMIIIYSGSSLVVFAILYFLLGLTGAGQTLSFAKMADTVSNKQRATAMGLNNTAVMLGGAILPPIIGLLVEWSADVRGVYDYIDFSIGFIIIPILYIVAMLIAWFKFKS